jgi:broad specificity phosphatase PhoE
VSSLFLVRHAQASFHADDYDQLSERGVAQAQALGGALAERGVAFDAVYCGPQRRHQQTLAQMSTGSEERGVPLGVPTIVADLGEIDATALGHEALERVTPSCPDLKAQVGRGELDESARLAFRHYVGVFKALMKRWTRGELEDRIVAHAAFETRVMRGLHHILRKEGRGRRVLVVTSGGPVSVIARHAIGASPEKGIELMFALRNASITELSFTEDELNLIRFNDIGLLPANMITGL